MSSKPSINARLEHVTRKGERRQKPRRAKKEKAEGWSDRLKTEAFCFPEQKALDEAVEQLTEDLEKDLFKSKAPKILGLEAQMEAPPAPLTADDMKGSLGPTNLKYMPTAKDFEVSGLKSAARAQQITIKKLERALAAAQMKIADLELEALYKEQA